MTAQSKEMTWKEVKLRTEESKKERLQKQSEKEFKQEEALLKQWTNAPEKQFFYLLRKIINDIELVEYSNQCGIYFTQNEELNDIRFEKAKEIFEEHANDSKKTEELLQQLNSLMKKQRQLEKGEYWEAGSKEETQLRQLGEIILPITLELKV